ncbi:MAG TPA: CBS domain-containing protein [Candidatus Binataceae bacterium]|nr:CBS domain-containing protein [Candidatus Binataceae bacterium]
MKVHEIMTSAVECCTPSDTAHKAAEFMREADAGVIPVIVSKDDPTVIGVVTDRDLCMDVVARGRHPDEVKVNECMTRNVVMCRPEDEVERAADLMAEKQIRRMPVVNDKGAILGIVSLADVARSSRSASEIGEAVHDISESTPEPSLPRGDNRG